MGKLWLLFGGLVAAVAVHGAEVGINSSASGNVDWNTAIWGDPVAVPGGGNDYVHTGGTAILQGLGSQGSFAGDKLTLNTRAVLRSKGSGDLGCVLNLNGGSWQTRAAIGTDTVTGTVDVSKNSKLLLWDSSLQLDAGLSVAEDVEFRIANRQTAGRAAMINGADQGVFGTFMIYDTEINNYQWTLQFGHSYTNATLQLNGQRMNAAAASIYQLAGAISFKDVLMPDGSGGLVDLAPGTYDAAALRAAGVSGDYINNLGGTISVVGVLDKEELLNFDGKKLPDGWTVEGFAFGSREPNPKLKYGAGLAQKNQKIYETGKMISPEFEIEDDYLRVKAKGSFHPERCTVRLVVDDRDVRSCSVGETWFDVRDLRGKKARLEVRDLHTLGLLETVSVAATSEMPNKNARVVTGVAPWLPRKFEKVIDGNYLLLPVGTPQSLFQKLIIEVNGEEKLTVNFPLAVDSISFDEYLPVYDLTEAQGKTLTVSYHGFDEENAVLPAFRVQDDMPERTFSDETPAFHVSCRIGGLNDPNGLFYLNGVYNMFFQYRYGGVGKAWAHYTSTDLVRWAEKPIALFPDHLGQMFSGSAAVDVMNTTGFGDGKLSPVIAAFTGCRYGRGGGPTIQLQGIAYSTDAGRTFTKYEGNPVVGADEIYNTGRGDSARDPKIFWFSPSEGISNPYARDGYWVMLLFERGKHVIYTSKDCKTWEHEGAVDGFHECPELFPLAVDGDPDNVKWIMYGASGEYHIGDFNGKSYTPETVDKIQLNHLGDNQTPAWQFFYAAQTFNNMPLGPDGLPRRVQIAWQNEQISFPTELTLRNTPQGLRVCMLPVDEMSNLYAQSHNLDGTKLSSQSGNPLGAFDSGLYDIELVADMRNAGRLELDIRGNVLTVDPGTSTLAFSGNELKLPSGEERLYLRIVVDNHSTDIFVGEHGAFHLPNIVEQKNKNLGLKVSAADVVFSTLRVHELESIWGK